MTVDNYSNPSNVTLSTVPVGDSDNEHNLVFTVNTDLGTVVQTIVSNSVEVRVCKSVAIFSKDFMFTTFKENDSDHLQYVVMFSRLLGSPGHWQAVNTLFSNVDMISLDSFALGGSILAVLDRRSNPKNSKIRTAVLISGRWEESTIIENGESESPSWGFMLSVTTQLQVLAMNQGKCVIYDGVSGDVVRTFSVPSTIHFSEVPRANLVPSSSVCIRYVGQNEIRMIAFATAGIPGDADQSTEMIVVRAALSKN